jgi:hypothetical protein
MSLDGNLQGASETISSSPLILLMGKLHGEVRHLYVVTQLRSTEPGKDKASYWGAAFTQSLQECMNLAHPQTLALRMEPLSKQRENPVSIY